MNIKRFLTTGELDFPLPKNTDELREQAGDLLDASCSWDIMGQVVFEGDDGKFYVATVEVDVTEAHPQFLKQVMEEIEENGESTAIFLPSEKEGD